MIKFFNTPYIAVTNQRHIQIQQPGHLVLRSYRGICAGRRVLHAESLEAGLLKDHHFVNSGMSNSISESIREIGPRTSDGCDHNVDVIPIPGNTGINEVVATQITLAIADVGANTPGGIELGNMVSSISAQQHIEPPRIRSKINKFTVVAALFATLFVAALNQTIVATAIPTICSDLQSASGYAWIGGAYFLANATAAPLWTKLSDIWGRKPILLSAVGLYFLTSIICALSTSMKMLIVSRACQGTAGGGLMQLVNITISDLFSMRERSLYLGLLELIWAVAGGAGPVMGGLFTQFVSWRWIFWINLPISGFAFLLLFFFLDVHNPHTPFMIGIRAIDWFGSISLVGLMAMLLLGLDFGGVIFPWNSPNVIGLIVAGGCMAVFFLWSEKSLANHPIMPLGIFSQKSNIASLLIAFFHSFVYMATEYYLPLFFQSVLLSTPLRSGTLLLPIVLTEAFSGIACGIFIHRTGSYLALIHLGNILLVVGVSLYTLFSASSSLSSIISFQVIAGLGTGLLFTPPLLALQAHVKQEDTATATSTFGLVRNLSTCLSVVIGGVIFQNGIERRAENLLNSGLSANLTSALTGNEAAANEMLIAMISDSVEQLVVKEAFAGSLRNIWILCAVMAGCSVICGGLVKRKVLNEIHIETKTGLVGNR